MDLNSHFFSNLLINENFCFTLLYFNESTSIKLVLDKGAYFGVTKNYDVYFTNIILTEYINQIELDDFMLF